MPSTTTRPRRPLTVALLALFAAGLLASCARSPRHHVPPGAEGSTTSQKVAERDHAPRTDRDRQTDASEGRATPFHATADRPVSTFSIDVDTGSYTRTRQAIRDGRLPDPAEVRAEEFINFFQYDYPEPDGEHPVSITTEMGPSPFGPDDSRLMRVGLDSRSIDTDQLDPVNLVFLVDVSGSMDRENKLPMVKHSLRKLLDELRPSDMIGIVVYSGSDGVALEPTPVEERDKIEKAIENMEAGGRTHGQSGIVRAYEMAESIRTENGINRVVMATDGEFNAGKTGDELVDYVAGYRDKHIGLTVLGVGNGTFDDAFIEKLTGKAHGNYFFVDSTQEANRIFGEQLPSTLEVLASDVKIQVEFDPDTVERYRLIGYANRALDKEDFADDTKDAGEIGPGHTVTAYYEYEPVPATPEDDRVAEVRLRYKPEFGADSRLIRHRAAASDAATDLGETSADYRFGAAVAEFAEILGESQYADSADFQQIRSLAESATLDRERREAFLDLVDRATDLWSGGD
jgi:Ca-activated chloride channel family protein